jgi:DNA-binding MarR family transcriptional regulator
LPNKLDTNLFADLFRSKGEYMVRDTNPTAQRLMQAFMQLNRAEWHQSSIAGCTFSEIRVLMCVKKGAKPDAPAQRQHELLLVDQNVVAGIVAARTGIKVLKVSEISKMLHVTSPTITQLLKGLELNGLIERHMDQVDRRSVGIVLTEKGEMVTQKAREAIFASFNGLIEYLGEEQSEQLAELLSKVFCYYNEKAASENQSHWHGNEEI